MSPSGGEVCSSFPRRRHQIDFGHTSAQHPANPLWFAETPDPPTGSAGRYEEQPQQSDLSHSSASFRRRMPPAPEFSDSCFDIVTGLYIGEGGYATEVRELSTTSPKVAPWMAAQESMETRRSDQQEDAESMPVVVRFEKKPQADDAGTQTWKERERDLLEELAFYRAQQVQLQAEWERCPGIAGSVKTEAERVYRAKLEQSLDEIDSICNKLKLSLREFGKWDDPDQTGGVSSECSSTKLGFCHTSPIPGTYSTVPGDEYATHKAVGWRKTLRSSQEQ